jgi:PTS system mannose-specific IIB component
MIKKRGDIVSAIALFRIDERLVHGQIVVGWVNHVKARDILVVDDVSAKDQLLSTVLMMACPPGLSMQVVTVNDAVDILSSKTLDANTLVVVKTPVAAKELLSACLGIFPQEINMGNAGSAPNRKKLTPTVYLDDANQAALVEIVALGHTVFFQTVPTDTRYSWEQVIKA